MKKQELIKRISPVYLQGIAHRGLHNEDFSENGLPAFNNAIVNGFAFECDIHLTKDNVLVVIHDSNLKRMTGNEGIVEELTVKQIKENYSLPDGSKIPTLREVLDLNNERVPMAIELKVYKNNYKALGKKVCEELAGIKDKSKFFLISFDPRSLWACKKLKLVNSLILGTDVPWTWKMRCLVNSIDFDCVLLKEDRCRKYCKKHFANTWTINTMEKYNIVKDYVDTVTFENMDPEFIRSEMKKKNNL